MNANISENSKLDPVSTNSNHSILTNVLSQSSSPLLLGEIKSAATPPIPRPYTNVVLKHSSATTDASLPPLPRHWKKQPNFTVTGNSKNAYDQVTPTDSSSNNEDNHIYMDVPQQNPPANDIDSRLQRVEDAQKLLSKQLSDFKTDITAEIFSLKEMTSNIMALVQESTSVFQSTIDNVKFQIMENADHLGKQVMDVRRDFVSAFKQRASTSGADAVRVYIPSFEWEIPNIDNVIKHQKGLNSPFYEISKTDCKVAGGVVCAKDANLLVLCCGSCTHRTSTSHFLKSYKFECGAYVVDKSGKHPDYQIGTIHGDLSDGKEWGVGEVAVSEIKKIGYISRSGVLCLKFVFEISA